MALDETSRARLFGQIMRRIELGTLAGMTKPDLRAAVDAVDDWVDAAQASYNNALPLPFRTQATLVQKSLLLCWVVMRRAGLLPTPED